MNDVNYDFQLSPAELQWLARAFGIKSLPLPADPFQTVPHQRRSAELDKAHTSLQTRGLLQRLPGSGWQVDRLPAAIIRWMSAASEMVVFEILKKPDEKRREHIFILEGKFLSLLLKDGTFHFSIYREIDAFIDEVLVSSFASISAPPPASKTYQLPQPMSFLPAAWNDSSMGGKMLKTAGLPAQDLARTKAWVKSLTCAVALTKVMLDKVQTPKRQVFMGGDGSQVWLTESTDNSSSLQSFTSKSSQKIKARLKNLI